MRIVERIGLEYRKITYFIDDGTVHTTMLSLAEHSGVKADTIYLRLRTYPDTSPLILHVGPITQLVFDHYGIAEPFTKYRIKDLNFDRSRCRRGLDRLCDRYSECQSRRVNMEGFEKWVDPGDTDTCFTGRKV